jgi:hypothetical protein
LHDPNTQLLKKAMQELSAIASHVSLYCAAQGQANTLRQIV